jgi:CTP synthase (UTP-ammonia lyase)
MKRARIALVGDFDPDKLAHAAIERSFALAESEVIPVEHAWLGTNRIVADEESILRDYQGIWCAPGSPYRNAAGALWAIQFARTRRIPFLGTCGGVQHALLEYARNVLGLQDAAHEEIDPKTSFPLLHRMHCSLVEKLQQIKVVPGSPFRAIYGAASGEEGFHCSFGLNPAFEHLFDETPLKIVARSEEGEVRAVALEGHPFFVGTLFQPERRSLTGRIHPLVRAFLDACCRL